MSTHSWDNISFVGGISTRIFYNENDGWILASANSKAFAESKALPSSHALGKNTWEVHGDQCNIGSYTTETKLKLTGCKNWDYTCDDGQCVQMKQRCDQVPDCEDRSDEKDCQMIELNEGYNKVVPPFITKSSAGDIQILPAEVNVSMEVFRVMSLDEVDNTIDLKFEIKMEWFDHRLTYNNLKGNRPFLNALNETDLTRIWRPLIVYQNTEQFERTRLGWVDEWRTIVMIARKGNLRR